MPKRSDQTTNQLLAKPNHPLILAGLCLLLLVIGTTGLQASTVVRSASTPA